MIKYAHCYLTGKSHTDPIIESFSKSINGKNSDIKFFLKNKDPFFSNKWNKRMRSPSEATLCGFGLLRGNNLLYNYAVNNNIDFLYFDNTYFGKSSRDFRRNKFRISLNSFQHKDIFDRPADRMPSHIQVRDWKKTGGHILILPPTPAIQSIFNVELWLDTTMKKIRKNSDREIRVRYKPNAIPVKKVKGAVYPADPKVAKKLRKLNRNLNSRTLMEDLEDCWAVVTFNSSAALRAVELGIPAFVGNESCLEVLGNTDLAKIESPVYSEQREQLYRYLSYNEFSLGEINNGIAASIMRENIDEVKSFYKK